MNDFATRTVRSPAADEAGFTLAEVLVAMSLLSIFMAMATAGMLTMYRAATKTEAISLPQSQLHIAFQRLEKTIRYASEISEPGQTGADWYVEYRQLTADGATCGQLRLRVDRSVLQQREWTEGAAPGSFATLASNVSSARPFELVQGAPAAEAAGANQFQRLKVVLTASAAAGPGGTPTVKNMSVAFAALNAPRDKAGAETCSKRGRAAL